MTSQHALALLFVACLGAGTNIAHGQQADAKAAPESVKPGINARFLDPELDVDEWAQRFEVESREIYAARERIVAAVGLEKGDRVADIGTGTGLFVGPFAQEVGRDGWVYALDIAPKFVERIAHIARDSGLTNVTPVLCAEDGISLPPESIDVAFICDVYHHFEYPRASLATIHSALKPGGELVLIDFERVPGVTREWVLGHVRAGKETFRAEIEEAGLEFVEEVPIAPLHENYFLRFRKPAHRE